MQNKTSESMKKAISKYKKSLKRIPLDVKMDYYEEIVFYAKEYAHQEGKDESKASVRGFIINAINEKIQRMRETEN